MVKELKTPVIHRASLVAQRLDREGRHEDAQAIYEVIDFAIAAAKAAEEIPAQAGIRA